MLWYVLGIGGIWVFGWLVSCDKADKEGWDEETRATVGVPPSGESRWFFFRPKPKK